MADEVQVTFVGPGDPAEVQARWKTSPPDCMRGFRLVDEAYDALIYESRYYDWPQKLMFVTSLGFALLFKGFMGSTFRLTVRFEAERPGRTKVMLLGTAHPRTRRQVTELVAAHGGSVGLRVGV